MKPGGHVSAFVQSDGGDIRSAMKIGRTLRQYQARVSTGHCMSSCVLVLIGGVQRSVFTYKNTKSGSLGVGLHRPYFAALPANFSSEQIAEQRRILVSEVEAYMKEMNVSTRLLELMEAIPPEKMRMLTAAEVSDLGLDAPDPIWDEKDVASKATYYGVSSVEFRQRRSSVDAKCPDAPSNVSQSLAQIQDQIDCEESVLWGLRVQEYRARDKHYARWVEAVFGGVATRRERSWPESDVKFVRGCRIKFMVVGAQTCER